MKPEAKAPNLPPVPRGLIDLSLGWTLVTLAAIVPRPNPQAAMAAVLVNSLLLLLVCGPCFLWTPLYSFFLQLPRLQKCLATGIVALVLFGHLYAQNRETFPLVTWDMFTWTWEPEEIVFHQLVGQQADGNTVPINLSTTLPSLYNCSYGRFQDHGEMVRHTRRAGHDVYNRLLTAIGRAYNRRHPESPVVSVAAIRGVIVVQPDHRNRVTCDEFWRVSLDEIPHE